MSASCTSLPAFDQRSPELICNPSSSRCRRALILLLSFHRTPWSCSLRLCCTWQAHPHHCRGVTGGVRVQGRACRPGIWGVTLLQGQFLPMLAPCFSGGSADHCSHLHTTGVALRSSV